MKSTWIWVIALVLFTGAAAQAEFRAAIAVRMVTPDPLLPLSGGVGPSEPAGEKRGELTVRALVLEDQDTRAAIVSTDFLGFPAVLGNRTRKQVAGIPPENILIGATHTHSGPDMYGFADAQGHFSIDIDYAYWVSEQIGEAIHEALENLQPASVKVATGEAQGKIAYNYYAPQLYDPRCSVVQFVDSKGSPFITLVNYAVHPEVLGNDRGILSPDLIGPLYERIAEQGGGTGIFMNGALGGMITADNRRPNGEEKRTWQECRRIGRLLADEALRIAAEAPAQNDPTLFCAARPLTFPIDSPLILQVVQASPLNYQINADNSITTQLNVLNLGNVQMLTLPGEALPNIGYYLKRNMHGEHNLLLGLTNDAFGYILTKEDFNSFKRYDYITRTSLGERTGEILVEEALRFVNRCPKPERLGADSK